jgi:hypothetical protein
VGDQLIHISKRIDVLLVVSAGEMEIEKNRMSNLPPSAIDFDTTLKKNPPG